MKTVPKYDPNTIESKWQARWLGDKIYEPNLDTSAKRYYNLHMFPYPSAEGLHVGNVYAFTGADIHGRLKRMQGYDVFQPFGLDGFGIHSENYALKVGVHPMDQAEKSEKRFYDQVKQLGSGYDWSHVLETYKEDYYKWTQWVFIQLFKAGLAYRENVPVNYCPSCKTVLADEQVIEGKCERCGAAVEKRDLEQWMFRITTYAEELLEGLDRIEWTEKVKIAQRNWIGKSEGAAIQFSVVSDQSSVHEEGYDLLNEGAKGTENRIIEVFTTRPDTLYGATFLVVSPEHDLVKSIINSEFKIQNADLDTIKRYVAAAAAKSDADRVEDKEKTGVFTGALALNPINNQQIPIWIADYVLSSYGTGAIMAVPAHDQRDFEFAKKYDLPIIQVVATETGQEKPNEERRDGGCGVVFDPSTQKYAVATHPDGLLRLFSGGVADGEDLEKGILREVAEESGLYDFGHVERIQTSFTHFYNSRKNVNRSALATCYLAILKSSDRKETHLEKHEEDFKLHWASPEEVLENWNTRNIDHGLDHWVDFMKASVARAIELGYDTSSDPSLYVQTAYKGEGILINSGEWNGLTAAEARKRAIEDLAAKQIGEKKITFHLRDWLISRQRYWGPPIPMIYCESCADKGESWFTSEEAKKINEEGIMNKEGGAHSSLFTNHHSGSAGWPASSASSTANAGWYPAENLPVVLPRIDDYKPIGDDVKIVDGKAVTSPLGNHPEFFQTTCPHCGGQARRETDVSDTFLDSAWYFYRYFSTDDNGHAWTPGREKKWMPVSIYTGGAEHSVLHLLYSRFVTKAFKDAGLISDYDEPFPRFFAHGLIIKDGAKMSKSKGNVIVPDTYISKFGADTLRTYLMFLGPFDAGGDFRDSGIEGMNRFMKRVWTMMSGQIIPGTPTDKSAISMMHKAIKGATEDLESFHFNTAIAKIMTYYNFLIKQGSVHQMEAEVFLKLLAPFAPHMTEEIYQRLKNNEEGVHHSIHVGGWPEYDAKAIQEGDIVIAVQINGKLRSTFQIDDASMSQEGVEKLALEQESVARHLEGKDIKKTIYVPGKILNYVVA